jgi:hypothetical protein
MIMWTRWAARGPTVGTQRRDGGGPGVPQTCGTWHNLNLKFGRTALRPALAPAAAPASDLPVGQVTRT